MRLLWLDPIGTDAYRQPTLRLLRAACRADTDIDFVSLAQGRPLDLEDPASEAIVAPDIVAIAGSAGAAYDGILIGCFFDTALPEARAVAGGCIVTGPCEATTQAASQTAGRFSILVGSDSWVPRLRRKLEAYGTGNRLASIRSAGLSVAQLGEPSLSTLDALARAGREAVDEDGADMLIVGCTADTTSRNALELQLRVPVLDSVVAPFIWLEDQVRARKVTLANA
jgi:allantoin racemase